MTYAMASRKRMNYAHPYHALDEVPFLLTIMTLSWTDFLLRLMFRYNGTARNETRGVHAGTYSPRR